MKFRFLVLIALSFVGVANASQDIGDVDIFEKKYIKCMRNSFRDSCMEQVLTDHFDPFFSTEKQVLGQTQTFFNSWRRDYSVSDVHVVGSRLIGDMFDIRSYLIELSNGEMAGLRLGFKKTLGKWYIFDIQGAATDSFIRDMVDMPELSPKK